MQPNLQMFEVLILGGGPSGLSTALHLARLAPQLTGGILVLEKAHYPRVKLCAGGLVADAELILERLGLDVGEVPHVDASAAHLDFAGQGLTISLPRTHTLRIIRRDEFDNWLAEKVRASGIEIREGITVRKIVMSNECVTVETSEGVFRARVLVGADGSNGITRAAASCRTRRFIPRVLEVITPVRNSASNSAVPLPRPHQPDHAYFDFFPVPYGIAGYTWDFPTQIKGQACRCWGIYDTNVLADQKRPPLKDPLAEEMQRNGYSLDEYEIQGHPIRWFSPFSQFSAPRVVLVGDAAGADGSSVKASASPSVMAGWPRWQYARPSSAEIFRSGIIAVRSCGARWGRR